MTVKEFLETTNGKPLYGIDYYNPPKNEKLLV